MIDNEPALELPCRPLSAYDMEELIGEIKLRSRCSIVAYIPFDEKDDEFQWPNMDMHGNRFMVLGMLQTLMQTVQEVTVGMMCVAPAGEQEGED